MESGQVTSGTWTCYEHCYHSIFEQSSASWERIWTLVIANLFRPLQHLTLDLKRCHSWWVLNTWIPYQSVSPASCASRGLELEQLTRRLYDCACPFSNLPSHKRADFDMRATKSTQAIVVLFFHFLATSFLWHCWCGSQMQSDGKMAPNCLKGWGLITAPLQRQAWTLDDPTAADIHCTDRTFA